MPWLCEVEEKGGFLTGKRKVGRQTTEKVPPPIELGRLKSGKIGAELELRTQTRPIFNRHYSGNSWYIPRGIPDLDIVHHVSHPLDSPGQLRCKTSLIDRFDTSPQQHGPITNLYGYVLALEPVIFNDDVVDEVLDVQISGTVLQQADLFRSSIRHRHLGRNLIVDL